MTTTHELPLSNVEAQPQIPTAYYGGFKHDWPRNMAALSYIEETGRPIVDSMPDPTGIVANDYTIAMNGVEHLVSARAAMRYAGNEAVTHSLSKFQEGRAKELNEHHEAQGHRQVNAIFQSADALMGLQAVRDNPEGYRNIILAYPAGIARQPRIGKASVAVAMSSVKSRQAARKLSPENDYEAHLRSGAKPRTVADKVIAPSVALSYQAPLLNEIRTGEHAPGISMVLGLEDNMMRPDKVIKELQSSNDVDYILITDTSHGINGRKDVMDKTLELMDMTEQARADREAGITLPPLAQRLHFYGNISESKRVELLSLAAEVDARSELA
jgi:hypothetical protein